MAKSKKKQQEDKAKALGCGVGVLIILTFSACNAIFGDDEPDPLATTTAIPAPPSVRSSTTSTPPNPDEASRAVCADSVQAAAYRKAGWKARADQLGYTALDKAARSAVPELVELGAVHTSANGKRLRAWCAANHPEIKADPVKPKPKKTRTPRPRKTTSKPAAPSTDPRFGTCGAANDAGYGPYHQGQDPEYAWYQDRDGDGVVCES